MQKVVGKITSFCVSKKIIEENDAQWLQYGLEKRISMIMVGIPFFIVAVILTNVLVAISFFFSFYLLRSKINGYHSKTIWGCIIVSLALEVLFCGIIYRLLSSTVMIICAAISLGVVFLLAPYNHPNIPLTQSELGYCRKISRLRVSILISILFAMLALNVSEIAKGITLGITMSSCMLCLPYILKRRCKNEQI